MLDNDVAASNGLVVNPSVIRSDRLRAGPGDRRRFASGGAGDDGARLIPRVMSAQLGVVGTERLEGDGDGGWKGGPSAPGASSRRSKREPVMSFVEGPSEGKREGRNVGGLYGERVEGEAARANRSLSSASSSCSRHVTPATCSYSFVRSWAVGLDRSSGALDGVEGGYNGAANCAEAPSRTDRYK